MKTLYNSIGMGYSDTRQADPRIAAELIRLLGLEKGCPILDIGAGTGNYSEALASIGFQVTALEPSSVMRAQGASHPSLKWVDGFAEELPFADDTFDGVFMTLCMHHFRDWRVALREARRVANSGPLVIFTFDAFLNEPFWLYRYFPDFLTEDREWFPKLEDLSAFFDSEFGTSMTVSRFPVPSDIKDHFLSSGWARPEQYLDPRFRAGISSFSKRPYPTLKDGLDSLKADLESGAWDVVHGHLRKHDALDTGYVFIRAC
ncbi:MAG: class I SAM-dependent methyltransferase [Verrucomicrobiota bacterium]